MAVLPIRIFGDPVLKEKCPEVAETAADLEQLIRDMADSLPQPGGAGLSANQIGIMKRVFIFDDEGEIEVCINPHIVVFSGEEIEEVEGCLSLPGVGVPVSRYTEVQLEYTDIRGEKRSLEVEGWLARVFQHELDHLDGTLILDRTDRASRVEALELIESAQYPDILRGPEPSL